MSRLPLSLFLVLLAGFSTMGLRLAAEDVPASQFVTPVTLENIDPGAFAEWVDGSERPVPVQPGGKPRLPESILWTTTPHFIYPNFIYADSKTPGPRYLRFGFKSPVTVGSILVHGGGQLSVLKPDAAYPGDLRDDSQWIPAQRIKAGRVTSGEATEMEEVLWVLPSVTSTRALRFTHVAGVADRVYGGSLGGVYVLSGRFANLSTQAVASARAMPQKVDLIQDEMANGWNAWSNITPLTGDRPKTIAEDPEWVMLTWPTPVALDGLALLDPGFVTAEVQIYTGPNDQPPLMAREADWKTVKTASNLQNLYPGQLPVNWIGFDQSVTTRAIRLRMTTTIDETKAHPHLKGRTNNGKRVWLDELMALQPLDAADLKTALLSMAAPEDHAPIAVKFTLPQDGWVTLVIGDSNGKRVRNLISETPFPKGENTVYWDGTDDLGRDVDAAAHGLYNIPSQLVAPGTYSVRGLWHDKINLSYEMSVYSSGNPPWSTPDTTGGWMTNHTPASCAVFVPGRKAPGSAPMVLIGSYVSEGGSALSWVDLDGNKLGGRGWVGGNWTGAQYLATDNGDQAVPGIYAYVGASWKSIDKPKPGDKEAGVIRLTGLTAPTSAGDKPVLTPVYTFDLPAIPNVNPATGSGGLDVSNTMGGLAVHDGLLVFSQPTLNQLVFVDVKASKVLGTAPLPNPHGVAFDEKGRLLVLSDKTLLRFTLDKTILPLGNPESVVSKLLDPRGLTLDAKGNIYISDRGTSHQVKVFSADGNLVKTYGNPGEPKAGPYDPNHMNNPKGLAVDSNGRLWVTEEDYQPKRVSVWNADGALWKAFYGPQQYGGGGAIDPEDGTRFSYDGMEFHLDWDKGEAPLRRIYYRTGHDITDKVFRFASPEGALYFHGNRYLTNAFNSNPTNGNGLVFLFLDKGDEAVPVAAMGRAREWDIFKEDAFKSLWPPGYDLNGDCAVNPIMFSWSDLNGDGQVQPNEVKMWADANGGITIANDGSFVVNNVHLPKQPGHVMRYRPVDFTKQGVPVYDPKGEVLSDANGPASSGGDQALVGTDGWTVLTTAPPPFSSRGLGGAKNAVSLWSYPSLWPGLHASHEAPAPDRPGELIGTTRLLGDFITPKGSDAGPLFVINGNMGCLYVFTQDGLFVTQLFHDVRQASRWQMPQAQRGMLVNDLTLGEENFFPTVTQVPDGSIYLMAGGTPALVKVDGLESIHRLAPISITVSADDLKLAQDFVTKREAVRQAEQGSGILEVTLRSQAPALDCNLADWTNAQWALIDQRGVAANFNASSKPYDVKAAVTMAEGKLFGLWQTGDEKLLQNSGEIDNAPFKTGGALDLMIGMDPKADPHRAQPVAGDLRLLVTQVKGKTKAELYRAVVPGTADKDKVPFNAPWHGITLDSVTDVSDKVQLVADGKGNYEIAVPLDLLGLHPQDGMKINGDIGILRGDGTLTTQRVYWNNKATAIVSDVPSEAMLTPSLWGVWEMKSK
jgi:hypothetical protein